MTDTLVPRDDQDVLDAVRWGLAHDKTFEVVGHGSRRGCGRPLQTDLTLDLSALAGVTLYEPAELVLSAKAGTPLAEIAALLAAHGQELAFEPIDHGPLYGLPAGRGTLGGALAANASGPRRLKAGAARDHFLGFAAVSGRGEVFKAGGRVVKNVTGYDMMKGLAGSWGTLAVMTTVTVKVLPAAETVATVLVYGLDEFVAVRAMAQAMGSACEVSGAVHLPRRAALHASDLAVASAGKAVTALRLEGIAPSVAARSAQLTGLLKAFGPLGRLEAEASRLFWREVRDLKPFHGEPNRAVWRVATAPMQGAEVSARLTSGIPGALALMDQAGAVVWAAMAGSDPHAWEVRNVVAAVAGHATLVRATAAERAKAAVFEPEPAPLAALTRRVKDSFDPRAILCPGRMWAGV